ncbi:MAG: hypothetical protein PUB08_07705 [Firmicutes bacterium]|nr:hypothetical protein [Bacillota bacterium]
MCTVGADAEIVPVGVYAEAGAVCGAVNAYGGFPRSTPESPL